MSLKTLYLLRHATAMPAISGQRDHERHLSEQGCRESAKMGDYLRKEKIIPRIIYCSDAIRTRETLEGLAFTAEENIETHFLPALYEAEIDGVLKQIHALPAHAESALIVGHNPSLPQLGQMLAGSGDADALYQLRRHYPPCTLAVLTFAKHRWEEITAREGMLKHMVMVEEL